MRATRTQRSTSRSRATSSDAASPRRPATRRRRRRHSEIIEEERAMAKVIEQNWDKFAELSLQEEGITV